MRTAYSRAKSFKEKFNYVESKKMFLGRDENRIERLACYVLLRETLVRYAKTMIFFVQNPSCVKLVLYQDTFEVVKPFNGSFQYKLCGLRHSVTLLPSLLLL